MKRVLAALCLFAAALAAMPCACAQAGGKPQRLALVIGNGSYKDVPLANPVNDARDMAQALEAAGFQVIRRENATLREMHLALREFGDRLARNGTGLVYFAGHGMQVRGRNFLIPVDADILREDEVAFSALDLGAVMEKLDSARNPVNIVIIDACRDNPFGSRLAPSVKGLAQIDAPPGTLIAFATAPGSTAVDGEGRNGLYTGHLLKQMQAPAPIEDVFKAVRAAVRRDSRSVQVPWESTSLETPFAFHEAPRAPVVTPPPQTAAAASKPRSVALGAPPQFARGDSWSYRVLNRLEGSERTSSLSVKETRSEEVRFTNGWITDLFGNVRASRRKDGEIEVYKPSNNTYVFPLRAGESWKLKALQERGERKWDLDIELKVAGTEEVALPAGSMRAIRIERTVRWKERGKDNAGTNRQTYWYNGAVKRYVAAEFRNETTAGKALQDERYELVTYRVK